MIGRINKTRKSFIGAVAMSLVLLLGSALGFLLETGISQITKPSTDSWLKYMTPVSMSLSGSEGTWQVSTAGQFAYALNSIKNNAAATTQFVYLNNDIDLGEHEWEPISTDGVTNVNLYGNGHTISNLKINKPNEDNYVGLFKGNSQSSATGMYTKINGYDLKFSNVNIIGKDSVGTFLGFDGSTDTETLKNIVVLSGRVVGTDGVGGIVGHGYGLTGKRFLNCVNNATVIGNSRVGGIGGNFISGLNGCINTGDVIGKEYVGGLIGSAYCAIENSYAECNIYGESKVGGLTGLQQGLTITNSGFNGEINITGTTTGTSVGSLIGYLSIPYTLTNCYGIANINVGANSPEIVYKFGAATSWDLSSSGPKFNNVYNYSNISSTSEGITEYRKYKVSEDETEPFSEFAYHKNINGGYPFPKSLFAVGQFIECDTMSYLKEYKFNPIAVEYDGSHYYVELGQYPQTYVGNTMNTTLENWYSGKTSVANYTITGQAYYPPCYAYKYTDGKVYARLSSLYVYSSGTFEDGTSVSSGPTWFKVEPIKWRILNYSEFVKGAKPLVISEKGMFSTVFVGSTAASWAESPIRRELRRFYPTLFSTNEQEYILTTEVDNVSGDGSANTSDNLFCLSFDEASTYFSSNSDRICKVMDYAFATHSYMTSTRACAWWLRTRVSLSNNQVRIVDPNGALSGATMGTEVQTYTVRPAMYLDI